MCADQPALRQKDNADFETRSEESNNENANENLQLFLGLDPHH